jgi:hypothetical protein
MKWTLLDIGLKKWLILVGSIFSLNCYGITQQCNLQNYAVIHDEVIKSKSVHDILNLSKQCGINKGTYYFEITKLVNEVYLLGSDSELDKYKIASSVILYQLSWKREFMKYLEINHHELQHAYMELCSFEYWVSRLNCQQSEAEKLALKKLPHAMWWLSSFYVDNQEKRIELLRNASSYGHVDASVSLILAELDNMKGNELNITKNALFEIAMSGKSISAEISYLRFITFGIEPFKVNSEKAIEIIKDVLEYHEYSDLYYFLAIAYFDMGMEYLSYMEKAAVMGNEDAIEFLKDE